jgi:hypothetical protein
MLAKRLMCLKEVGPSTVLNTAGRARKIPIDLTDWMPMEIL